MTIHAKVIADSISAHDKRLLTFEITAHRWILAEINTHRALSRNYRSSRAVPVAKLLAEVRANPAMPVVWMKNRPGMQATEPMAPHEARLARDLWQAAARSAADQAESLAGMGMHKAWANRLLEPFLYVHGVITATEWDNFYALRRHPDAQPEFRELADAMWAAQQHSTPTTLRPGEWHLPYITENDTALLGEIGVDPSAAREALIKTSVARCARVSYRTHDGHKPSIDADLQLYARLVGARPIHASPAEHQATPDTLKLGHDTFDRRWAQPGEHGNFVGWRQHRKQIEATFT